MVVKKAKKEAKPNWRPAKVKKFLEAMQKVLTEKLNAIIMTDEELFIMANDLLEEECQICYATFKNYKRTNNKKDEELYDEFLAVYKKALVRQKKTLFDSMTKDDQQQWQKYAWIIERKFSNWNLKHVSENKTTHSWEIWISWILWEIWDSKPDLRNDK